MIRLLQESDRELFRLYCLRHYAETTFLSGNVVKFGLTNNRLFRRCGDYYGYFADENLQGVLAFYNQGNAIPHYESEEAIMPFVTLLLRRDFESLLGMQRIIQPLYAVIKRQRKIASYKESVYYVNYDLQPYTVLQGNLIDLACLEQAEALKFMQVVYKQGFQLENSVALRKMLRERGQEEDYVLGRAGKKLVAQACIQSVTERICQIGAVYTLPAARGKGWGKALVTELCQRICGRGKLPALMVKQDNALAVRVYEKLGFTAYDNYLLVKFKTF